MEDLYLLVIVSVLLLLSLVMLIKVETFRGIMLVFLLLVGASVILLKYF